MLQIALHKSRLVSISIMSNALIYFYAGTQGYLLSADS